jgi:hypothetical protein
MSCKGVQEAHPELHGKFMDEYRQQVAINKKDRTKQVADKAEALQLVEDAKALNRAKSAGPPSWGRIDPRACLEAAAEPREPTIGSIRPRDLGVFYMNCINEVHGESENGKSWFVLYVVAQVLDDGMNVTYVDYESDEGDVYRRLQLLGISDAVLLDEDRFYYHRPNGPLTDAERELLERDAEASVMVVFDGVTEGMMLEGLTGRDEADVAKWHSKITKDIVHAGKCVVVIDHTPKDDTTKTIGSQHKKAAVGGVSYLVDAVQPIGAGVRGCLRLKVEKDRPASVRRDAAPGARPQWRADMVIDFSPEKTQFNGRPDVALWDAKPKDTASEDDIQDGVIRFPKVAACIVEALEEKPGLSGNGVRTAVPYKDKVVNYELELLIDEGRVETRKREGKGGGIAHYVAQPKVDLIKH